MVKFSDLEKAKFDPQTFREKNSGSRRVSSGLSFRDLEKETYRAASREAAPPMEASEEERRAIYDTATEYLAGVLDAVRQRLRFALEPGEEIVRRMIESRSTVDPLLIRAIYQENSDGFLVNHCVNVTVFAVKMAAALGLSTHEQEEIGLAALLHEVGMGVIPAKLINKKQKLDEREYAIFRKRPEFAFKILKGFGDAHAFLGDTALQVHECMDGSGYPVGLSGDEIHLYAQIIGLADMYEALTHSRPQREKFPHFAAVKQVIKTGKRRYAKKHLKALLNIFSIFPLHSFVKLNSNAVGRVIQTYPEQPMRPRIEVVFDSQGRRVLTRHVVDLSENSILYVVDSVSEKDIAGLAEGPGAKQYAHPSAPIHYGLDAAILPDREDADGAALAHADIPEITEADFEPPLPAAEKQDSGAVAVPLEESDGGEETSVAEMLAALPAAPKGRRLHRNKWVLLAAGMVLLAGVLLWQLGLTDRPMINTAGEPKRIDQPSGKTSLPIPQKKAKGPSAAAAVSKKAEIKPAAPEPSKKEKAVAMADGGQVLKERAPALPDPSKGAPPLKAEQRGAPPLPAAAASGGGSENPQQARTAADSIRADVAAGLNPAGSAAALPKARSGAYPFSIKLDSYRTLKEARSAVTTYTAGGINAYWVKANLGSQGIWYRIFSGAYPSGEEAALVIRELGLGNAAAKETKYAALIGMYPAQTAIDQEVKALSAKGYSSYVIPGRDRPFCLLVGAFYTRKGAEEQVADLRSNGIQSEIFER